MSGGDRINIFPSRANHVWMRQRIVAANKGLSLLKRKRDALDIRMRELNAELKIMAEMRDKALFDALFSMAKANFLGTDFKPASVVSCVDRADIYMRIQNTKVVGLLLPKFELFMRPPSSFPLTGLSRGGVQVDVVRSKFQEAVRVLITMASLEYSAKVLKEGIRQNNQRVNGLEYVLIPRFVNTVAYIRDELDEFEREDFYRLKRSQAKQRRNKEIFSQMLKRKNIGSSSEDEAEEENIGNLAASPSTQDTQNMADNDEEAQPQKEAEPQAIRALEVEQEAEPETEPVAEPVAAPVAEPEAEPEAERRRTLEQDTPPDENAEQ